MPWTGLDFTNVGLHVLTSPVFSMDFLTCIYLSNNNLQYLPPDISRLAALETLDLSNNKLRLLPPELGKLKHLKELLLYNNNLQTLPYELGNLVNMQTLGLQGNPLSEPLASLAKEGAEPVLTYLLDNAPFNVTPPPERPWVHTRYAHLSRGPNFSVLCYNVLCDKYATKQLYP